MFTARLLLAELCLLVRRLLGRRRLLVAAGSTLWRRRSRATHARLLEPSLGATIGLRAQRGAFIRTDTDTDTDQYGHRTTRMTGSKAA